MSAHSARMSYGANMGLSRLHCVKCNDEMLHKMARCIHRGTAYEVTIPKNLSSVELRAQINVRNFRVMQERKRRQRRLSIAP